MMFYGEITFYVSYIVSYLLHDSIPYIINLLVTISPMLFLTSDAAIFHFFTNECLSL